MWACVSTSPESGVRCLGDLAWRLPARGVNARRVFDLIDQSPGARQAGPPRIAGAVAAVGFLVVAGYQVLLALGTAFSGAAWGGATLTPTLRLASAVSAVVLVFAALIVSGRTGFWGPRVPAAIFRWGTWVLVGVMAISALANFASPTAGERFFLGPAALLLAALCLAVTRVPSHSPADFQIHASVPGRK
jgi:hypothetical protein